MQTKADDLLKGTTLGLAVLALAVVGVQIDAKSMLLPRAPAILSIERPAPFCKIDENKQSSTNQMCKANFKKEVADGAANKLDRK